MKSKKFTYLLVACVIAIWGIIFQRIYMGVSANDDVPAPAFTSNQKKEPYNLIDHKQDTFKLALNYRDPFLDKEPAPTPPETALPVAASVQAARPFSPVQQPMVNWSAVKCSGYINNPLQKKKVFIIALNGQDMMLSEGESKNGIKLLKHAGDSLKIEYQNSTKYIHIQ